MPMTQDPKKTPEPATEELQAEELDQVSGGAAYIKFDGIDGESTKGDHGKWIDVLSYGAGVNRRKG